MAGPSYERLTASLAPDMKVLELLDYQPEFRTAIWDYLAALVDDERVVRVSDPATVVAVWGVESNFGRNFGARPLLTSLSTLSCYGRRQAYFRGEFFDALKIVDSGDVKAEQLTGSWAGAFGHTQFMPSTFLRLAVDFDDDGRRDLVGSVPDALASTANFLKKAGWREGEPWDQLERPWHHPHRRQPAGRRRRPGRAHAARRPARPGLSGVSQLRRHLRLQRRRKLRTGHRPSLRSPAWRRSLRHAMAN